MTGERGPSGAGKTSLSVRPKACYQSILEREAVATIPPRRSARLSESVDPPAWRAMRDAHLREIRRLGRYEWRISSGCTRQSLAENAMSRFKTLFALEKGPTLHRLKAVDSTCD